MVLMKDIDEIAWKICRLLRIRVGNMGDKIDELL